LNAKWTSPGGDCKLIEGHDVSLRWYASSGTLMIKGEKATENESQLRTLIDNQTNETRGKGSGGGGNGGMCLSPHLKVKLFSALKCPI
jgi:hypothetical protein